MENEIKNDIRYFLETDPFYQESIVPGFSDEMLLLNSGSIDSIGIFNLIVFLESKYAIKLSMEDLNEVNFSSLNSLVKFVKNKIDDE